jgi:hypothetical protein
MRHPSLSPVSLKRVSLDRLECLGVIEILLDEIIRLGNNRLCCLVRDHRREVHYRNTRYCPLCLCITSPRDARRVKGLLITKCENVHASFHNFIRHKVSESNSKYCTKIREPWHFHSTSYPTTEPSSRSSISTVAELCTCKIPHPIPCQ